MSLADSSRLAFGIEYDGGAFQGWQRLGHGPSVQAAVEEALSSVADAPVQVQCAGRTDAGVHARCQVVHMDAPVERSLRSWLLGGNSLLPASIALRWAQPVAADFHARYCARARRYSYRLLNRPVRPALHRQYLSWERRPLDVDVMHRAAQALVGEHDFSAFRAQACQARSARRDLQFIEVRRDADDIVVIEVQANAFLHHMIRNLTGSLLVVGRGERPENWLGELLRDGDRTRAGPTAPATGLTLLAALYPRRWGLPDEATLDDGVDPAR